jgi:hypothetical protein
MGHTEICLSEFHGFEKCPTKIRAIKYRFIKIGSVEACVMKSGSYKVGAGKISVS